MNKGAPSQVLPCFIDQALEGCIEAGHDGYIINPWGQSFALKKELIELLFEADRNWQEEIREKLEDGSMLKAALEEYQKEPSQRRFSKLLRTLRSSWIWIPGTFIMSEEDQKHFDEMITEKMDDLESLEGTTFVNQDETRFRPDILQNGEEYFFPVFTGSEEMGEYGMHFSTMQRPFTDALILARSKKHDISGIVVNAFTEPFVLRSELFEYMEKLKPYQKEINLNITVRKDEKESV